MDNIIIIEATLDSLAQAIKLYRAHLESIGIDPTYDDACYKLALASIAIHEEWERIRAFGKQQQNVA